jgi:hypothetical protein
MGRGLPAARHIAVGRWHVACVCPRARVADPYNRLILDHDNELTQIWSVVSSSPIPSSASTSRSTTYRTPFFLIGTAGRLTFHILHRLSESESRRPRPLAPRVMAPSDLRRTPWWPCPGLGSRRRGGSMRGRGWRHTCA